MDRLDDPLESAEDHLARHGLTEAWALRQAHFHRPPTPADCGLAPGAPSGGAPVSRRLSAARRPGPCAGLPGPGHSLGPLEGAQGGQAGGGGRGGLRGGGRHHGHGGGDRLRLGARGRGTRARMSSGGGPPGMVTLGAKKTASSQGAPRRAWGQSTTSTRSAVRSRLSARRSRCSRSLRPRRRGGALQPDEASGARDHGSSVLAHAVAVAQLAPSRRWTGPQRRARPARRDGMGDGVRHALRALMASRTPHSSARQGRSRPAVDLLEGQGHLPWRLRAQRKGARGRRGQGGPRCAPPAGARRGSEGLGSGPTALRKIRWPEVVRRRSGDAGENPLGRPATGLPGASRWRGRAREVPPTAGAGPGRRRRWRRHGARGEGLRDAGSGDGEEDIRRGDGAQDGARTGAGPRGAGRRAGPDRRGSSRRWVAWNRGRLMRTKR